MTDRSTLSANPRVNIIERIEIIKSGPGNLGRTNAIGGNGQYHHKEGSVITDPVLSVL